MKKQSITYSKSGVNYEALDPIKKLAQVSAKKTSINLKKNGFNEIEDTRGESAYVWQQDDILMASVIEGLGTKNLIADKLDEKFYEVIGHDTVASIINDLISVGAKPLVIYAYWATGDESFLRNVKKITSLINGWKKACDIAGVTWGGGETPSLKGIINPDTIDLGGSAIGIIKNKKHLLIDKKIKRGDRILFLKSTGINANGLSLARAVAKKLPKRYATKLNNGKAYGEEILKKTNIYAKLIQDLLAAGVDIHYLSNITGHGLRKIMRGRPNHKYIIEKIFKPQELFLFIQKHTGLSDFEMYETYNMGQDYAIFLPKKDVKKAQEIVLKNKFKSIDAGYVERGEKQVIIKPKNIIFKGTALDLR